MREVANGGPSATASDGDCVRALDLGGVLNGSSIGIDACAGIGGATGILCAGVATGLTLLYRDMLLEIDSFFGGADIAWGGWC